MLLTHLINRRVGGLDVVVLLFGIVTVTVNGASFAFHRTKAIAITRENPSLAWISGSSISIPNQIQIQARIPNPNPATSTTARTRHSESQSRLTVLHGTSTSVSDLVAPAKNNNNNNNNHNNNQNDDQQKKKHNNNNNDASPASPNIVLVAGFESFNRRLYQQAAEQAQSTLTLPASNVKVFSDSEIRTNQGEANPTFVQALRDADIFIASLIFDYDDVQVVLDALSSSDADADADSPPHTQQRPRLRLVFESATELMEYNQVGSFTMKQPTSDGDAPKPPGPPPAVKAILSKFSSSSKEEDKLAGYLQLLKIGPDLLRYVPGTSDLKTWLESYRYWNQGGLQNASSMLQLLVQKWYTMNDQNLPKPISIPKVVMTPDVGLLHPHRPNHYWTSPREYLTWRLQHLKQQQQQSQSTAALSSTSPRIALLLYRKHVITGLRYINDLIAQMEDLGVLPIPIFINGVEAHTIVRDLLTTDREEAAVAAGKQARDSNTYQPHKAVRVDAIVNTIGFPLVGGPAGSMQAGRNVDVAQNLLRSMNVPYMIASPLLLQSIVQWKQNGVLGLQSVVLYSLPELDGAIDTVVLGGLVGGKKTNNNDNIALVPERVRKLVGRVTGWTSLRNTPPSQRRLSIVLYGFPPNVGAVGTAALLDVPKSLEFLLKRLHREGYDVGEFCRNDSTATSSNGESLVQALAILCEDAVIAKGAHGMQEALDSRLERARNGDVTIATCLAQPGGGGLGGATVRAIELTREELESTQYLGKYMAQKVERAWPSYGKNNRGPGVSSAGKLVVSGLQLGNIFVTVQPLLGVEGDPMRLLFERDLTPHPQYCAAYSYMKQHSDAVLHFGMHGTVEWLPGQALGNDRASWSDELLGNLPNIYAYAVNNPSESILAKRRGYGTLISYNVPPYGRAGLYMELANLKELIDEYRSSPPEVQSSLRDAILGSTDKCGILNDVPLKNHEGQIVSVLDTMEEARTSISNKIFDDWVLSLSNYLAELQNRLFSSGLHTLGAEPSEDELKSYLQAYFGDELCEDDMTTVLQNYDKPKDNRDDDSLPGWLNSLLELFGVSSSSSDATSFHNSKTAASAVEIASLLKRSSEELDSIINALDGGYVSPNPGGDLLRDGQSVLPTGRNIHALDPYRMPSAGAWIRGQKAAQEILKQHQEANAGAYPETVAVTLWGLDAIKTRGESVAIVLALVGATPVKEGTGRVVRFDLVPLNELGRPRVDVLASLSGIFRDSFANIVDLLDDMFERAAAADNEPDEMNYIKKHSNSLKEDGVERSAARLFSNPPGDYGSMVNEVVGSGEWEEEESLGETWKGRNVFSYGRNEGAGGALSGTARPEVLDKLLATTERVVQEVDSVEYGLTDIQEYYANTGALKKAAENRKPIDGATGKRKKVDLSIIEAFGNDQNNVRVQNVEQVLRMEYRSKLLNPKWRDAMLAQGSGGAFEVSQRMTAMVGWAATAQVDNFVFDQAAERYALDDEVARQLQKSNPEAFKNVLRRLLEAQGRGMWETDEETLNRLRELYAEADDRVEQVGR